MASSYDTWHTKQAEGDTDLQAHQYRTKDLFLVAVHLWLDASDHSGAYKVTLLVVLHLDASPIQIALSTLGCKDTHTCQSENPLFRLQCFTQRTGPLPTPSQVCTCCCDSTVVCHTKIGCACRPTEATTVSNTWVAVSVCWCSG